VRTDSSDSAEATEHAGPEPTPPAPNRPGGIFLLRPGGLGKVPVARRALAGYRLPLSDSATNTQAAHAEAAVLVAEASRAAGRSASPRPESTRGDLVPTGICGAQEVWAAGPVGEAVWRRKRSRGMILPAIAQVAPRKVQRPSACEYGRS